MKGLFSMFFTLLSLGSLMATIIWYVFDNKEMCGYFSVCVVETNLPAPLRQRAPKTYKLCKGCKNVIKNLMKSYSKTWKKQEDKNRKFRSQLKSECNGFDNAILTQANSPVGGKIFGKDVEVTPEIFSLFLKEHPFLSRKMDTCSVVGSGGILTDSGCGKTIDSADFVIRCNLPPLEDSYEKDVGTKTDLVTSNPSIIKHRFASLMWQRRPFVERLNAYGKSMVLLYPFSPNSEAQFSLRAAHTIMDFGGPTIPVFINPEYQNNLATFWKQHGLQERRLSTGFSMVSLALELCGEVHLYGFWPFNNHPNGLHNLQHHYYDNRKPGAVHKMPDEFKLLLQLHSEGVLKVHLGDCKPGKKQTHGLLAEQKQRTF